MFVCVDMMEYHLVGNSMWARSAPSSLNILMQRWSLLLLLEEIQESYVTYQMVQRKVECNLVERSFPWK